MHRAAGLAGAAGRRNDPGVMNGQSFVVQCDATDAEMRQFLKKYKIGTERRCHVIDDQSNIAMVEAGLGISIMPQMLLRDCKAAVKVYPIEPEEYRVVGLAVQRPAPWLPPWSRCSTTSWNTATSWIFAVIKNILVSVNREVLRSFPVDFLQRV